MFQEKADIKWVRGKKEQILNMVELEMIAMVNSHSNVSTNTLTDIKIHKHHRQKNKLFLK